MDDSDISKPDWIGFDFFKEISISNYELLYSLHQRCLVTILNARMPPPADVHLLVTVSE